MSSVQKKIIIYFFRNDLRLHDNPVLMKAVQSKAASHILPCYVFDPRFIDISKIKGLKQQYEPSKTWHYGLPRCSQPRARFIVETILDLQKSLKSKGSNLLIQYGKPEKILPKLIEILQAKNHQVLGLYFSKEFTHEELLIEEKIQESVNIPIHTYYPGMLVDPKDLPFPINQLPNVYSQFRTKIEKVKNEAVRKPLSTPTSLKPTVALEDLKDMDGFGSVSDKEFLNVYVQQLCFDSLNEPFHENTAFPFKGGESTGLDRLQSYLWGTHHAKKYKETRNGLLGESYSTKFSPWLANGSLSPRLIIERLSEYEEEHGANESTYWIWFELLWREYFKFVAIKFGNQLFFPEGLRGGNPQMWKRNKFFEESWSKGETGIPFVDANMKELLHTGFMSNRGRQNVASFWTKDVQMDWRFGAEWFESMLIDHDVCSNYGNWLYVAGLGNDPRQDRQFNMIKQAKDYDPEGIYVKSWCPQLKSIPNELVQTPWKLSVTEQEKYRCVLGKDYPKSLVIMPMWERHAGRKDGNGSKIKGNPSERVRNWDETKANKQKNKNRLQGTGFVVDNSSNNSGGKWKRRD